jgi:hypothetical protein
MSAMRIGVLLGVLAAVLASLGCGDGTVGVSPQNLDLVLRSDTTVYRPADTFSGTLTFISLTIRRIRQEFPDGGQYHVGLFDSAGALKLDYFPNAQYPAVSYLELEPHAARTDTVRFALAPADTQPEGEYRVRAWIEGHTDIRAETSILLRW